MYNHSPRWHKVRWKKNLRMSQEKNELTDAEVAAVTNYTSAKLCISCKAKVDPTNDRIGSSWSAQQYQRLDKCSLSILANLIIDCKGRSHTLHAFLPLIQAIAGQSIINEKTDPQQIIDTSLMADPFSATYTHSGTINAVYRSTN